MFLTILTVQGSGIGVITEMIFGYLYPWRPLANLTFRCYGVTAMGQALWFLSDFKLGYYMKIPPKSMYIMQVPFKVNHHGHAKFWPYLKVYN